MYDYETHILQRIDDLESEVTDLMAERDYYQSQLCRVAESLGIDVSNMPEHIVSTEPKRPYSEEDMGYDSECSCRVPCGENPCIGPAVRAEQARYNQGVDPFYGLDAI